MKTTTLGKPAIALAAALTLATAGFAQETASSQHELNQERQTSTDTWRDEIGPNDVRVLGKVAEVRDETFTLRSHDATYIFEIPSDPEQSADVRTGNDVQVWYDPAGYERDGDTWYRVSYLTGDQTAQVTYSDATETEGAEASFEATAQSDEESFDASAELEAEATVAETSEAESFESESLAAESEYQIADAQATEQESERMADASADNEYDEDEKVLPQTAGSLPLLALGGLIALLGAVALRMRLS
jgi:hypothetical protein